MVNIFQDRSLTYLLSVPIYIGRKLKQLKPLFLSQLFLGGFVGVLWFFWLLGFFLINTVEFRLAILLMELCF